MTDTPASLTNIKIDRRFANHLNALYLARRAFLKARTGKIGRTLIIKSELIRHILNMDIQFILNKNHLINGMIHVMQ